ncbi:hypothetical protein RCH10_005580 [Variovorax sp. GrIS 2.14]|uniref:hypothetical protein n=1 Tax=Variovorax sp. GrIS 2.14 TaxID=3071709 RepID=UPI0038F61BAE
MNLFHVVQVLVRIPVAQFTIGANRVMAVNAFDCAYFPAQDRLPLDQTADGHDEHRDKSQRTQRGHCIHDHFGSTFAH